MSALANYGHSNLLSLIQSACKEMNLPSPATVFTNVDTNVQQLLSLAQREGKEMYKRPTSTDGWQMLRKEYVWNVQSTGTFTGSYTQSSNVITMTTTPATAPQVGWVVSNSASANASDFVYPTTVTAVNGNQVTVSTNAANTKTGVTMAFGQDTYPMPTDIDHLIPQTFWDRSFRWQLLGPIDAQEWQVLKSGISPTGPRRRFRIIGGNFCVDPVPADNNQLVYEYYSSSWCQSAAGVAQSAWAADTDTYLLDDDTMVLGLIWRYRRAKGFDYETEKQEYDRLADTIVAQQAGARNLPLNASGSGIRLLNTQNVPDTGFGS
jgi:hypothetical protein